MNQEAQSFMFGSCHVREAFGPADVFPRHMLMDWAENNGYEEQ